MILANISFVSEYMQNVWKVAAFVQNQTFYTYKGTILQTEYCFILNSTEQFIKRSFAIAIILFECICNQGWFQIRKHFFEFVHSFENNSWSSADLTLLTAQSVRFLPVLSPKWVSLHELHSCFIFWRIFIQQYHRWVVYKSLNLRIWILKLRFMLFDNCVYLFNISGNYIIWIIVNYVFGHFFCEFFIRKVQFVFLMISFSGPYYII